MGTRGKRDPVNVPVGPALLRAACMILVAVAGAHTIPSSQAQTVVSSGRAVASKPVAVTTSVQFTPVAFRELPEWGKDDHASALAAFMRSCDLVIKASRAGNKAGATPTTPALLKACDDALKNAGKPVTAAAARAFFEINFVPHAVVHAGPSGLLTGYYEPTVEGARQRSAKFPIPLYRRPPELVNLVEETERGAKGHALTHGRQTGTGVEPFATRAEIEQGALKGRGLELAYLPSAVDAFFLQVQGSGRIVLPDGSHMRITYDGKNGHPYMSVGRHLIDSGHFTVASMSLAALSDWLKADAERGRRAMWQNKSYVFFRELTGDEATRGPQGVLHIPLATGRSLAVDTGVHAIGTPIYVSSPALTHAGSATGFNRLMVAHDVGSAIKGPERGDIYFGSGADAGKIAGVTKHPGRFFVLLPHGSPTRTP